MTDVFAAQDEIGQAISEALKVRPAPPVKTVNIEAWQLYLKGRYHFLRYTPESMAKAKECFELALAIDPDFAPAYSELASYCYVLAALGMMPVGDAAPLSKWAAGKALAIDPADAEAHSLLATLAGVFDYDWKPAGTHHRMSMAAENVPPFVRDRYALNYLLPLGRLSEAIEQSRLALETDPLSPVLQVGMASSLYNAKRYGEAIECLRRAMEIDPNFHMLWVVMGMTQIQAGASWLLAAAYHIAGDGERSQEWVRKLAGSHGHSYGAATYYVTAGDADAMFAALDGAYAQHNLDLRVMPVDPFLDPYRANTRYQSLLRRMNLA